jgi:hypothetical protein
MIASWFEKLDKTVSQRLNGLREKCRRDWEFNSRAKARSYFEPLGGTTESRALPHGSEVRISSRRVGRAMIFFYRKLGRDVIVVLILIGLLGRAVPRGAAQDKPQLKRPHDTVVEKPAQPKKKSAKGPRAIGVLQLTSAGKGSLIPVAILIDGKFYDAGAYKADPVPMALESGTVYEAEQAGDSLGLFTVIGALHSKSVASPNPWVGTGSFLPHGAEVAKTTHKAEDVPVGMDNSDEPPPRLTKKSAVAATPAGSGDGPASPTSSGKPPEQVGQKPSSPVGGESPSDKSAASDKPAGAGNENQKAGSGNSKDQTQSASTGAGAGMANQSSGESAGEYYRPALRRGKPTESAPEEEKPPVKVSVAKADSAESAKTSGGESVQLVPAISDAGGPDPRSYKFFWKTGEEEEKRNLMLALAAREVRAYAAEQAKNQIPAKPGVVKAGGRKAAAKPVDPVFERVHFHAYDVWVNNQPVMILTAEGHFPAAAGASATGQSYSIALVARTDIYGDLRKLYSGVTDRFHLDVTPELDLVDVVDVDGDGRGELLFHETSDTGSGYVIYRATADKLWKMFDSLNAM